MSMERTEQLEVLCRIASCRRSMMNTILEDIPDMKPCIYVSLNGKEYCLVLEDIT